MKELFGDDIEKVSGAGIVGFLKDINNTLHSGGRLIQDTGVTAKSAIGVLGAIKSGSFHDLATNVGGTAGGVIDIAVDIAHVGSDAFGVMLNGLKILAPTV